MDSGSIGFVLICAALVFFMTPGLSCFYGGLVRRKNAVNTMYTSVITIGIGIVMWVLFGYSLSFGTDHAGIIGGFNWIGLEGVSATEPYVEGQQIPNLVFCCFQMMFAVITPALITGSIAGRMKFKSLFLFLVLWSLVVYYPMAHMVWADGGFLAKIGSVDFAGGTWYTSAPVSLHWCSASCWESAMTTQEQTTRFTASPWLHWAHSFWYLAGSALTQALRWQQMAWQHMPS